ncbi:hypothetical protein NKOR_02355 [Candidatus Nitrosopumilus koreensis AR1]|uniref:Uncharacterized protein n=1 Tax=Candidatus Nitrosopumilus koreensis AR1 TaxID=1229908 RepID=K0B4L9_9ARCH|nr:MULTISPECIES: hypothetical protein [Nitrosopumilus]AFS80369.1 hypothetical protein NKOR_02355 [Candidatus Nitrosopumilus koreensis AR1]
MTNNPIVKKVSFDKTQIRSLERKLEFDRDASQPGKIRTVKRGTITEQIQVPELNIQKQFDDEIIKTYEDGIRISSQIDSTPLIPMYKNAEQKIPPKIITQHETMKYDFYLIEFFFGLMLKKGLFPKTAQLNVKLSDDVVKDNRKTFPTQLFPGRKDKKYFEANVSGSFGINADLEFSVPEVIGQPIPFADVKVDGNLKSNFILGPFQYEYKKASIEVSGLNDPEIFWKYNMESELHGTNDFKSIMILKVAQEAKSVQMKVKLGVIPYKKEWHRLSHEELPLLTDEITQEVELIPR